ncbi:MAG: hypothetical protein AAGC67_04005 [Myxococcota bacterium]
MASSLIPIPIQVDAASGSRTNPSSPVDIVPACFGSRAAQGRIRYVEFRGLQLTA